MKQAHHAAIALDAGEPHGALDGEDQKRIAPRAIEFAAFFFAGALGHPAEQTTGRR